MSVNISAEQKFVTCVSSCIACKIITCSLRRAHDFRIGRLLSFRGKGIREAVIYQNLIASPRSVPQLRLAYLEPENPGCFLFSWARTKTPRMSLSIIGASGTCNASQWTVYNSYIMSYLASLTVVSAIAFTPLV